ncbi:HNH endonuclease [Streptomyces sp. H27-H5]|uniref:HNH endonuclease n=1 Tax=Streptomyces sp. H27-H5 TaxID=2996460 RepID=UPI0022712335|nr:HNH endonuclease [Streptomyces sp. H27-H5]MCY0957741.1 HNH endonuclease [Streptomyces sp. H27-H5]
MLEGKRLATHVALEVDGRPRPGNLHALHSCDTPSCVNPAHLRWGTNADNVKDRGRRGRFVCNAAPQSNPGEQNGRAKLSEDDIRDIRARYVKGHKSRPGVGTAAALAKEFAVSAAHIHAIASHKTWGHTTSE